MYTALTSHSSFTESVVPFSLKEQSRIHVDTCRFHARETQSCHHNSWAFFSPLCSALGKPAFLRDCCCLTAKVAPSAVCRIPCTHDIPVCLSVCGWGAGGGGCEHTFISINMECVSSSLLCPFPPPLMPGSDWLACLASKLQDPPVSAPYHWDYRSAPSPTLDSLCLDGAH